MDDSVASLIHVGLESEWEVAGVGPHATVVAREDSVGVLGLDGEVEVVVEGGVVGREGGRGMWPKATRNQVLAVAGDRRGIVVASLGEEEDEMTVASVALPESAGEIVQLEVGLDHALVRTCDSAVWSLGRGTDGQLGCGKEIMGSHAAFVPVHSLPPGVKRVMAGGDVSAAVTDAGALYLWGNDEYAQCLTGDRVFSVVSPRLAPSPMDASVSDVVLGTHHGLARVQDGEEGRVVTWGWGPDIGSVAVAPTSPPHPTLPPLARPLAAGSNVSLFEGETHLFLHTCYGVATLPRVYDSLPFKTSFLGPDRLILEFSREPE